MQGCIKFPVFSLEWGEYQVWREEYQVGKSIKLELLGKELGSKGLGKLYAFSPSL